MKVINDLIGYEGMKVVQNTEWFSFSLDSVLLPRFVTVNKGTKKIELRLYDEILVIFSLMEKA